MSNTAIENEKAPASQNVRSFKFQSKFKSLLEALKASEIDLSYNPETALDKAKWFDNDFKSLASYIGEDGEIYSHYQADDGLVIIGKFSPFSSCLDDCDFKLVSLNPDCSGFVDTGVRIPKSGRKTLVKLQASNPSIAVLIS